jgi:multidrug efflux pump subunit AcrB
MVQFLIRRPIAVIMVYIAVIVLGIIAYRMLPVSLMPDIPIPQVTVNITYKNSSARELENAVVKPIRAQLMQVGHLSQIKSETRDGQATIGLQFDYGTNVDYAFIEVNEKIDGAMNSVPRDVDRPRVIKASATDIPVFYLNLTLKDASQMKADNSDEVNDKFMELSDFGESVIRKRIEQLPEVSMVDMSGTVSPQLVIEPDMIKMQAMNLTLSQLESALSQNNVSAGNLVVRDGHYQYNIRFTSVLRNQDDVKNIYLKASGKIFQLKEVARVSLEPQKRNGTFASNGKPAITMAVIKQANAKLADMKDKINDLVTRFEKEYPGIHFEASQDQTQLLDISISNLKQNLTQGLWLVILVVFLFMKDMKLPLLIGLTLFVSVIISMLFFGVMHLSINIISLAGLILAAGNMMDNSIVVTDNISQYRERNFSVEEACVAGTNEVIIPQLSAMLVNVAVFVPLIFLSGIAGALMYDEAMSVTIGLVVSYLVGITFMPVIYRLAYKRVYKAENKIQQVKEKFFQMLGKHTKKVFDLEKVYTAWLNFTFRYKRWNILMYLSIIPIGVIVLLAMRKEKMPEFPQTEVFITVDWNENIHAGENKFRVNRLLQVIETKVLQSNAFIGHQQFLLNRDAEMGPSEARIYIKTANPADVALVQRQVKNFITKEYHNAKLGFEPPTSIFEKLFSSSEPPLVAELIMKNHDRALELPELLKVCTMLNNDSVLRTSNKIPLQQHILLTVNMEKLLLYNVSYDALYKELKTAFKENNIGTLRSFQKFIPIVVSGKEKLVTDIIGNTNISNNENTSIPVSALVSISKGEDLKTITAGKEGEYIPLVYSPSSNQKDLFINKINANLKTNQTFDVRYSGSLFSNIKLLKEIGIILIISVLLLYFILAAQFESLVQPLLVLLEIPIDFAAALLVLYITGQSFNLMSAMGMVIMSGIIITDSILKLDVINQLRKEGYPLMEAIKEGGHRRLRAILMTSLTSILAMIPLLFTSDLGSELQKPFSYALIGGMVIGTIVSLFLVPLVYYFIYRNERIKK